MSTIRAAQLIYTRVEPAYSPQMKGGFQTVHKGDSLSPADVSAIERRVQCFQPYHPSLARFQFFTLDNGAAVLTSSVQIEAHSEIVDRDRRKGAFIAHCLILSRPEFSKADYNPFAILDHFHFLDNAEDMVRTFGQAIGDAPPAILEVDRSGHSSTSWSGAEAFKMVTLALRGEQLLKDGKSVLLIGDSSDINDTLRMTFALVPKGRRLVCTFDTSTDRCTIRQGSYWAVGMATRQGSSSYIMVDAAERRVLSSIDYPTEEDPYLIWLKYASARTDFSSAVGQARAIQLLADAFASRSRLRQEELDKEACYEFIRLHEQRIMRDLESAVAKTVGKSIAPSLTRHLVEVVEISALLDMAASQYVDPMVLCPLVTDWLIKGRPNLKNGDLKALQSLARQGGDMRLLHLLAVSEKVDAIARDEALRNMNARSFQRAMEQLMDPIEPAHFVTPMHLSTLLSDPRLVSMSDGQFLNLVRAIVRVDAISQLDILASRVRLMTNESLTELEKMTRKHLEDIPESFGTAMTARREELGPPPSLLGFFRK